MKTEKEIKHTFRKAEARDERIKAVFTALFTLWAIGLMIAVGKLAGII